MKLTTKFCYGAGAVAYGVKDNGFAFFLLLYYNQVLGLPERWVGFAIMVALVLDAISDPIIGHVSDHWRSRWGRRHPFLYASAIPVAVSYYLLWSPPQGMSPTQLVVYLTTLAILVRTFITVYEIPSTSLIAELTDDYDERTSTLGLRYFFGWWGGLGMAVLAYSVFLQPDAEHTVGVLNPDGYRTYGLVASFIMVAAILVSAIGTHSRIPYLRQPPEKKPFDLARTLGELRETLSNRSFLALFIAAIFAAMAAGLGSSLNIYFATFFWELAPGEIALLALANFVSAAVALVVAPVASVRMGKKTAAIVVACFAFFLAPLPILLRLAAWFPENGTASLLPTLLIFNSIDVALIIAASILVSSMVADVVEDSEMATGRRSEGVFFAARSFVAKCVSGLGVFLSTILLSWIGFPSDAKPGEVDPAVIRNLAVVYTPLILGLYFTSVACLFGYGIDRHRHEDNLRSLASRRAAAASD